jgi:SWI/SNF-related matrix-associated actin-dependent regulator 1 of chromatin subfamily A
LTLFSRVFFDEAHNAKNFKAIRTQASLRLASASTRSFIFSGTPIPNTQADAFSQLKLAGMDVGETPKEFKEKFKTPEDLRDFLKGKFIRRRKEQLKELNIPEKSVMKVSVELKGEQLRIYRLARDKMLLELKALGNGKSSRQIPIAGLLAQLTRLAQIASNPRLNSPGFDSDPAKFRALDTLVKTTLSKRSEKLIIWTCCKKNLEELLEKYADQGAVALYSGVKKDKRVEACRRFKEDPTCRILIAIPACAREGFTLTSASKAIYLDRNFSYLDWAQSQDRIHRISQTKKCQIFVLAAQGTIDQRIDCRRPSERVEM